MKSVSRFPKIITAALTAGFIFVLITAFSPVKREILLKKRINILVLGISNRDHVNHAEVIKVVSFEPATGFFDIISVPRDTMIPVPYSVTWKRIQKADEIYARYKREMGDNGKVFKKFSAKLERFMGNRLNIGYYVQINYKAFTEIIDSLGGVEIDVVRPLDYDDNAQQLHIHISSGVNHFDGDAALKYVRYRNKITGDIGRLGRQSKFIEKIIRKIKSPAVILKGPKIIGAITQNIATNLIFPDILTFIDIARSVEFKNIRIQQIPGEPEIRWAKSYWNVDREGMSEVLDVVNNSKYINMPAANIDREKRLIQPVIAEVWNASGKKGYARQLTDYLRKRNVDVVRFGNYGVYKRYTQIISRNGALNPAREVAKIIGCRNIKTELDTSRMVDVNVVIGKDFKPLWKE
ncbi:MAG: LCP family protein [Elusimicrobia bacterium]|jgi:LCP family protein required for cell wall assembly|nr:LCP family protein [Elusimicrobiota bacterium]